MPCVWALRHGRQSALASAQAAARGWNAELDEPAWVAPENGAWFAAWAEAAAAAPQLWAPAAAALLAHLAAALGIEGIAGGVSACGGAQSGPLGAAAGAACIAGVLEGTSVPGAQGGVLAAACGAGCDAGDAEGLVLHSAGFAGGLAAGGWFLGAADAVMCTCAALATVLQVRRSWTLQLQHDHTA